MTVLFLLILHHFGDIQPIVIPAKNKIEACEGAKSWTEPKRVSAPEYAVQVVAVEGTANGAISAFLYEVSCDNIPEFNTDLKEIEAKVAGRFCRKFADSKAWHKYFQCVSATVAGRMADGQYIDILDRIDQRIQKLENAAFLEKGKKK